MAIIKQLYPQGKKFALTLSYDDGRTFDERLVKIMDTFGIRGSFHLNSCSVGDENHVKIETLKELYKNHEVSMHAYSHPHLPAIPDASILFEMQTDKELLEKYCGYTVRGMSYPFGTYNQHVIDILRTIGIKYSRTTISTNRFVIPDDFLQWHPTCHHRDNINELYDRFIASPPYAPLPLLYIWGHSYEFDTNNNWDHIEDFCKKASGNPDIWYATNIEIYDYVTALRSIEYGHNFNTAFNPSYLSVFIEKNKKVYELKPGENEIL